MNASTSCWLVHLQGVPGHELIRRDIWQETREEAEAYAATLDQAYDWLISKVTISTVVETIPYKAVDS